MKIKNTKTDILLNIAAVACLAAVTLYLLVRWSQIPMTIPGHYTADGQIDSWTARTTLWQLPVLGWVLSLVALASLGNGYKIFLVLAAVGLLATFGLVIYFVRRLLQLK